MTGLVEFLKARLDEDEKAARAASGGTVIETTDGWEPSARGDEWAATVDGPSDTVELLVALRPELPRPPDVMSGMWGCVISWEPDSTQPEVAVPLPQVEHIARHDPARVLREVEAKRKLIAQFEHYDASARYPDSEGGIAIGLETAIQLAALPYASHPEYDKSWRP